MIRKGDVRARSDEAMIDCRDWDEETESYLNLVQTQYKDECDLNVIMARYTPEQLKERFAAFNGVYGDYSDVMDYGQARMFVKEVDEAFMSLPAHVREKFSNDPMVLCDFLSDPANIDEAVSMGLIQRDEVEEVAPQVSGAAKSDEVTT